MMNFNTNQTRQFYVATAIDSSVDTNGDIALKTNASGDLYFSYKNADGILTRSDLVPIANMVSVKKTAAAAMNRKLMQHTVSIDTDAVALTALVGKTVTLTIIVREFTSYDADDTYTIAVGLACNATNTATKAAFHKDLAIAIAKALPKRDYPFLKVFSNGSEVTATTPASSVTGAAAGVVLVEAPQKWVRGKLSNEPLPFTVSFSLPESNTGNIVWGTDVIAASAVSGNTVIRSAYALADLEYFAYGERGDIYRGNNWPNNFETTYMINPADTTVNYNVLSIEYFWAGGAENVQKSPRLIQIAAPAADSSDIVTTLYNAVMALKDGGLANAEDDIATLKTDVTSLDTRVTALENA